MRAKRRAAVSKQWKRGSRIVALKRLHPVLRCMIAIPMLMVVIMIIGWQIFQMRKDVTPAPATEPKKAA